MLASHRCLQLSNHLSSMVLLLSLESIQSIADHLLQCMTNVRTVNSFCFNSSDVGLVDLSGHQWTVTRAFRTVRSRSDGSLAHSQWLSAWFQLLLGWAKWASDSMEIRYSCLFSLRGKSDSTLAIQNWNYQKVTVSHSESSFRCWCEISSRQNGSAKHTDKWSVRWHRYSCHIWISINRLYSTALRFISRWRNSPLHLLFFVGIVSRRTSVQLSRSRITFFFE